MKFLLIILAVTCGAYAQDEVETTIPVETATENPLESTKFEETIDVEGTIGAESGFNFTISSAECIKLNRMRSDLDECCEYPRIKYFDIYSKHCIDECVGNKDYCCSQICVWRHTKIVVEDGTFHVDNLKTHLAESVGNKDEWKELINSSVDKCNVEVPVGNTMEQYCKIPSKLLDMVTCSIKKLFLSCPSMHSSEKCDATKKYVETCM